MKLHQSAACPVCLEGPDTDTDDYQEKVSKSHAHPKRVSQLGFNQIQVWEWEGNRESLYEKK